LGEIIYRGNLEYILDGSWESVLFITELLLSAIIPALLFAIPRIRRNKFWLFLAAVMVVFGFILHRIDVSIISSFQVTGTLYIPKLIEFATSFGIVAIAGLVFLFFVENFSVYPKESTDLTDKFQTFDILSNGGIFNVGLGQERRYSFVYILGASLAIFILPANGLWGIQPEPTPVQSARNISVDSLKSSAEINIVKLTANPSALHTTNTLLIDGNRNRRSVLFDHNTHIKRIGMETSCGKCHHMNLPMAKATDCAQCHRDMYLKTDIFDHNYHIESEDGNKGCIKCHTDPAKAKNRETSLQCTECHKTMKIHDSFIILEDNWKGIATGYMQAMHGLCLKCHEREEKAAGKIYRTGISGCSTCHKEDGAKLYAIIKPGVIDRKNR
jgi:hypothetical protein